MTIETNRHYSDIMRNSPTPIERYSQSLLIRQPLYITIEPIMDFDMEIMVNWMEQLSPMQINIGADSGHNHLPEPCKHEVYEFINRLQARDLNVVLKKNINRILK